MQAMWMKRLRTAKYRLCGILLLVATLLLLAGCDARTVPTQDQLDDGMRMTLSSGNTVGQTFVATEAGLEAIEFGLQAAEPGSGEVLLHLRSDPSSSEDLATASLPVAQIRESADYRFAFSLQPDSRKASYFALLEMRGDGAVSVLGAPGSTYLEGARYENGQVTDSQASFWLSYNERTMIQGWLGEGLRWLAILALGAFLYLVPGWALLTALWSGFDAEPLFSRVGLSAGVSLALSPLIFLWTDVAGLHLGALYAWLPSCLGLVFLLLRFRRARSLDLLNHLRRWRRSQDVWPDLTAGALVLLVFGGRFAMIRSLFLPLWGDSVHHTMIAQLIIDRGGLFDSWAPYTDLATFTYHFGFHAAVAEFSWISHLPAYRSVLWVGQILNGLAVLALVPLTVRLTRSHWAIAGTVLVAGLVANQPAYYVDWGRYTQLAGQVVLPGAVLLVWSAIDRPENLDLRMLIVASVTMAGLALTHYRVLMFAIPFLAVYLALTLGSPGFCRRLLATMLVGAGAILLVLPWLPGLVGGRMWQIFAYEITTLPEGLPASVSDINSVGSPLEFFSAALLVGALLALGWGLWRRNKWAVILGGWWGLTILAANPDWMGLPGLGILSPFAVMIALYIPLAVLLGAALGWWMEGQVRALVRPVLAVALIATGTLTAIALPPVVDPARFAVGTLPDLRAAAWVQTHTPPGARFLIRSFPAFADSVIVGVDGGWWLPVLAKRQVSAPPINFNNEQGERPDFRTWTIELWQMIREEGIDDAGVRAELGERGYQYIYLGPQTGPGPDPWGYGLSVEHLLVDPSVSLVYAQDRVWIFHLASDQP
jgi:hypothetical protein